MPTRCSKASGFCQQRNGTWSTIFYISNESLRPSQTSYPIYTRHSFTPTGALHFPRHIHHIQQPPHTQKARHLYSQASIHTVLHQAQWETPSTVRHKPCLTPFCNSFLNTRSTPTRVQPAQTQSQPSSAQNTPTEATAATTKTALPNSLYSSTKQLKQLYRQ